MPETLRAILEAQKKRHKGSAEDGWCAACRYPTSPRCIEYRTAVNALQILDESIRLLGSRAVGTPDARRVPDPEEAT